MMIFEALLIVSLTINIMILAVIPSYLRTVVIEELRRFFEE